MNATLKTARVPRTPMVGVEPPPGDMINTVPVPVFPALEPSNAVTLQVTKSAVVYPVERVAPCVVVATPLIDQMMIDASGSLSGSM